MINKLNYNCQKDKFSDGTITDWYIWMPVEEAHFFNDGGRAAPKKYMDTLFFDNKKGNFKIGCPMRRYDSTVCKEIIVSGDMTVREVLQKIFDFYQEYVSLKEFKKYYDDNQDDYVKGAKKSIAKGEKIRRYELMGSEGFLTGERHPFMCSGLVRYEGAINISGDTFRMRLGS